MVTIVFFTSDEKINENDNFILGRINKVTNLIEFLPNFDITQELIFQPEVIHAIDLTYSKIASLMLIKKDFKKSTEEFQLFAIQVDKRIWKFESSYNKKRYTDVYFPNVKNFFLKNSLESNTHRKFYAADISFENGSENVSENLKYQIQRGIIDNEYFLKIYRTLSEEEQVKVLLQGLLEPSDVKSENNISQLLKFCLNYSRFENDYKILGERIGTAFVKNQKFPVKDNWIYSICDSGNLGLISNIRKLLLTEIKHQNKNFMICEAWADTVLDGIVSLPEIKYHNTISLTKDLGVESFLNLNENNTDKYYEKNLGSYLKLHQLHHFWKKRILFFVTNSESDIKRENFIITFFHNNTIQIVDINNPVGYSLSFKKGTIFTKENILMGISYIPSDCLESVTVIEVPISNQKKSIKLKDLYDYYSNLDVLSESFQRIKSNVEFTEKTEMKSLEDSQELYYDPFRYSYKEVEQELVLESQLGIIDSSQYSSYKDFHPFIKTSRDNVLNVTCLYKDMRENKEIKIKLMGWYISENQLKIRWKPTYRKKLRWRSSLVSVDIITESYFFKGSLYGKGSFPIFIKDLYFIDKISENNLLRLKQEFKTFLDIIESQKKNALLHKTLLI